MNMCETNVYLTVFLIFFTTVWNIECRKLSGPSLNIIKKIEKCNSTEGHTVIVDKYRINKYNRTVYTYNSEIIVLEELNDEGTEANFMAEVWGNGGWRKNSFNRRFKKACSTVKQLSPKYVETIFKQANITGCPIPKGTYVFKDLVVDMDIAVPVPYGLYKCTVEFFKDNKEFFCIVFIVDIVPRN